MSAASSPTTGGADADPPPQPSRLPAAVYVLGLTSLLNDAAGDMIYPLLPVFLAQVLGAGPAAIGYIEGAAEAMASLLKLVSGHLSDRARRRKPFVVAGYTIAALARPLIGLAHGPLFVLAVRLTDRFGKGLRASPRDALIADVTPRGAHARAFGVHEAMDHLGAVVGPLAATALLWAGLELRSMFLLSMIPGLAAVGVVLAVVREPARTRAAARATSSGATLFPARPTDPVAQIPAARGAPLSPSRPFVGYLAAVTLFTLGNSSDAFLLLRAHDAGLATRWLPLLWAGHHVVKSGVAGWGGRLADRIGRRRALALGWLAYAAVYAGFAVVTGVAGIVALFIGYGVHFGLVGGAQKALVADLVPPEARARGFGVYHLCVGLAAFPASALFGLLYGKLGAPVAFGTGATFALGAALLLPLSRVASARDAMMVG